jgi:hypothetical protein
VRLLGTLLAVSATASTARGTTSAVAATAPAAAPAAYGQEGVQPMVSDADPLEFVVAATAKPRIAAPLTLPAVAWKLLARAVKPVIAVAP